MTHDMFYIMIMLIINNAINCNKSQLIRAEIIEINGNKK